MTPDQDRILRDLTNHLQNRINQCQRDFVERCEAMEIPPREVLTSLCSAFSYLYIRQAVLILEMTPAQFARLSMEQFKKVKEFEAQAEDQS